MDAVLGSDLGRDANTGALARGDTVGRSPASDIVVADPSVSRMHARLGPRPDGHLIVISAAATGRE